MFSSIYMNNSIFKLLVCPSCRSNVLSLDVIKQNGENVTEGSIICNQCESCYPIVNSIPRMHKAKNKSWSKNSKHTNRQYAFWWKNIKRKDEYEENFERRLELRTNLNRKQFEDKIVVDVGCGSGAMSKAAINF